MTALDLTFMGLAAWRWAMLVTTDSITEPARTWLNRRTVGVGVGGWLAALVSCPYCVGVWAAFAVVGVWEVGWRWAWLWLVVAPAVAAVVSLFTVVFEALDR